MIFIIIIGETYKYVKGAYNEHPKAFTHPKSATLGMGRFRSYATSCNRDRQISFDCGRELAALL